MSKVHFVLEHMALPTPSSAIWLLEFVKSSQENAEFALGLADEYREARFGSVDLSDERNSQYLDEYYAWFSKLELAGLAVQVNGEMKLKISVTHAPIRQSAPESGPFKLGGIAR